MKSYEELQEEIRLLRQRLAEYEHLEKPAVYSENKEAAALFLAGNQRHSKYTRDSYASFVLANFRSTMFYRLYQRIYKIFKPTMIIVRLIRWLMIFLTMVQASVVLLFVLAVSLVALPILLLIALGVWIRVVYERKALHASLIDAFEGKRVLVFFSSGTNSKFFDQNMRTLLPEYTVLVVQEGGNLLGSRYVTSDGKQKRFLTAYPVSHGYYRIRQHYYFYLRKRYFKKAESVSVIY